MSPEPGIEGPPVWIVLWMPYLRAQATMRLAFGPSLTPPRPDFAQQRHAGVGEILEILLGHAGLDAGGAGVNLDAGRARISELPLRRKSPGP